jgi:hypothetical protein
MPNKRGRKKRGLDAKIDLMRPLSDILKARIEILNSQLVVLEDVAALEALRQRRIRLQEEALKRLES